MKILFISANKEHSPYPVAPIGALSVISYARTNNIDIDFYDLSFTKNIRKKVKSLISSDSYNAAAISIRNLDNCFYASQKTYFDEVVGIVNLIKNVSDIPIIIGGSGFSVSPAKWMKITNADYGVVGEGEEAFIKIINYIKSVKEDINFPNILTKTSPYEDNSKIKSKLIQDLDSLHIPAHQNCLYKKYISQGGFVSLQTKRGCPYKCIYCTYPALEGIDYRLRSPQIVADEIEFVLKNCGVNIFFFTDSVFNSPREHAKAVCDEIIKRRLKIKWMAYCNPIGFDNELTSAMKESGCAGVEFGLDAAIPKMLKIMGKPFSQDEIKIGLKACKDVGLPAAVHLLFGGPGETYKDIEETQLFLDSCATPNAVFASFAIRVYDNTPLKIISSDEGLINSSTDLFNPVYYISEHLTNNPVAKIYEIAKRRDEWSTQVDWMKPVIFYTQKFINMLGIRPQWKDIRNYGKYMRKYFK